MLQNDVSKYLFNYGISHQVVIYAKDQCAKYVSLLQQQISNGTLQDYDKDRTWKAVMVQMAQWACCTQDDDETGKTRTTTDSGNELHIKYSNDYKNDVYRGTRKKRELH